MENGPEGHGDVVRIRAGFSVICHLSPHRGGGRVESASKWGFGNDVRRLHANVVATLLPQPFHASKAFKRVATSTLNKSFIYLILEEIPEWSEDKFRTEWVGGGKIWRRYGWSKGTALALGDRSGIWTCLDGVLVELMLTFVVQWFQVRSVSILRKDDRTISRGLRLHKHENADVG